MSKPEKEKGVKMNIIEAIKGDKNPINSSPVKILYRNYRHEVSWRTISPIRIYYGENKWHKGPQWFLVAFDLNKKEERDFALLDIKSFLKE